MLLSLFPDGLPEYHSQSDTVEMQLRSCLSFQIPPKASQIREKAEILRRA